MSFPPVELRTARLHLRRPRAEDAEPIYQRYATDEEVTRYVQWAPHASAHETGRFLAFLESNWAAGFGHRAWVLDAGDGPIGMLGFDHDTRGVLVGYVLARSAWGQGLMTEAVRALSDVALAHPTIYRVWAYCDVANKASARVLERSGMAREGVLRRYGVHPNISVEPRDVVVYARVRD